MNCRLAFVRHGFTDWNLEKRIQGQSDIPLNEQGRRQVRGWHLPDLLSNPQIHSSPLDRCLETARLMGFPEPLVDAALMEMNWGEFEGRKLAELRTTLGPALQANEKRGIDFQPPGGESPRRVAARLSTWLAELGAGDHLVVTHKGVLRAAYSIALDWDMRTDLDFRLQRDALHLFHYKKNRLVLEQANVPL